MIGIDAYVLVRYIMQDDPKPSPEATKLMEALTVDAPGFVSQVSVIELVWVLGGSYELKRQQVAQAVDALLRVSAASVSPKGSDVCPSDGDR